MNTPGRIAVVDDLLRALVTEWGYHDVLDHLKTIGQEISPSPDEVASRRNKVQRGKDNAVSGSRDRARNRSAIEYVAKMDIADEKKAALLALASRFESRKFLPTIGDVRNFLEINDAPIGIIHGRESAVPKVVRVLLMLPDESLKRIIENEAFAGPSRLGPLSNAIKASRAAIRSSEESMPAIDTSVQTKATEHRNTSEPDTPHIDPPPPNRAKYRS